MKTIDNSKLIPRILPDGQVKLEDGFSPEWISELIIAEIRLATATPEGTIKAAYRVLDHYAQTGINGVWITPVYDKGETGNGYGSYGPYTIDPALTGTEDYAEGWQELKKFIEYAHTLNIRVFLDTVTWGTVDEAPIRQEHPEYFSGRDVWGGKAFLYCDTPWRKWFFDALTALVFEVGCDGFRCDCEPNITGYELYYAVRQYCYDRGRKIVIFSEDQNERLNTYDFEQYGVMQTLYEWGVDKHVANPRNHYLDKYNIVDSVKTGDGVGSRFSQIVGKGGTYRYYSFNTCCHDNGRTVVDDNLLAIGYQAILAPYIPVIWIGDEWGNISHNGSNCMYFQPPCWEQLENEANRRFFETVKKYIEIRRSFPEIFAYFPQNHRESNICKVESSSELQAYARFAEGKAVLVIPNYTAEKQRISFKIPFEECGIDKNKDYTVTDLINGVEKEKNVSLTEELMPNTMSVILIEQK